MRTAQQKLIQNLKNQLKEKRSSYSEIIYFMAIRTIADEKISENSNAIDTRYLPVVH